MAALSAERTGILVIRAWIEPSGEPTLRARITRTTDLDRRRETTSVAARREDVLAAVGTWLDELSGTVTER